MENLKIWDQLRSVPREHIKTIGAGRLKGMSDIKPQWRMLRMTEAFGPCGIGWKYTIEKMWLEEGSGGQKCAFCNVSLYVKHEGEWSEAIPGHGGNTFIANEKNGPYTSDEAYKMALTDALSVAMKAIGVGADIYLGYSDSKYSTPAQPAQKPIISEAQLAQAIERIKAGEKELAVKIRMNFTLTKEQENALNI
jgi:hypothetical protein